jgi:nucleoside-diphosphate-sugar epimerase
MKILVTGGLGFIGHNVVAHLEAQGHACVITDTQNHLWYCFASRARLSNS